MFTTVGIIYVTAKHDYEARGGFLGPLVVDAIAWIGITEAITQFASAGCI